jgi:hypothetical protein
LLDSWVVVTMVPKIHASESHPLDAISFAPALRVRRTRSQPPSQPGPTTPLTLPSPLARKTHDRYQGGGPKVKMATRRIVSEKTVLERDDKDFAPKAGEKSNITPAVPA